MGDRERAGSAQSAQSAQSGRSARSGGPCGAGPSGGRHRRTGWALLGGVGAATAALVLVVAPGARSAGVGVPARPADGPAPAPGVAPRPGPVGVPAVAVPQQSDPGRTVLTAGPTAGGYLGELRHVAPGRTVTVHVLCAGGGALTVRAGSTSTTNPDCAPDPASPHQPASWSLTLDGSLVEGGRWPLTVEVGSATWALRVVQEDG